MTSQFQNEMGYDRDTWINERRDKEENKKGMQRKKEKNKKITGQGNLDAIFEKWNGLKQGYRVKIKQRSRKTGENLVHRKNDGGKTTKQKTTKQKTTKQKTAKQKN